MIGFALLKKIRPFAEREMALLLDVFKQCDHKATTVAEWDLPYLIQLYKVGGFINFKLYTSIHFIKLFQIINFRRTTIIHPVTGILLTLFVL